MKFPTKKDIVVAVLCVAVPGAIIGLLTYFALKDIIKDAKKIALKKREDQKINKSTAGKCRRHLS